VRASPSPFQACLAQSYPRRLLELELGMTVTAMDRVYAFSD